MEIYTVKSGDTIFSIAKKYNVSPKRLISDNGIINPDKLAVGQHLIILFPMVTHTVKPRENLGIIAENYGTDVITLLQNNPTIYADKTLNVDEVIVISYDVEKGKNLRLSGFIYDFVNLDILRMALPFMSDILIFGYGFNLDGTIISLDVSDVLALSKLYKSKIYLSFSFINSDGTFESGAKAEKLFTDETFQNRVIFGMIAEAVKTGADGIDIDMEYIPPIYKDGFISFLENLKKATEKAGFKLHVCLAPKTSAEQKGLLYESHDYKKIGEIADYVFLMTYEWGYKFGPPLAIAPIENVSAVLSYALSEIPPEKIYLGMPNYAYDWELPFIKGVTSAETFGNLQAENRASLVGASIIFDDKSASPYYNYNRNITEHIVWFEDALSIDFKYDLISSSGIIGGGFWNLMRAFPQAFLLFSNKFKIQKEN